MIRAVHRQLIIERNEAEQHGETFSWGDFWPQFFSSTFENWQSEFLQLVWQAVGLAMLLWGRRSRRRAMSASKQRLTACSKIAALILMR